MKTNLLTLVVTLTVGIILAGSLLMPTLEDYTPETRTYLNEGVPYALADADDTDTHVIVVKADGLTSDGELIDASQYLSGDYTIVFGEHSIIRYTPSTGRVAYGGKDAAEDAGENWRDLRQASSEQTLTITITGDSLTAVNGEATNTIQDQWAYISTAGSYRYCVNPCVTSTDRIIGGGVTFSPFSGATVICFDGTIDNLDGGIYRSSPTATLNEIRPSTTTVVSNLLKIDAIYFDATQNGEDKTATYTYFLAPHEIVYENPAYLGEANAAILSAIPILVIVALVVMAAGALYLKRDD